MKIPSIHLNTELTWRGGEQQTLSLVTGLNRRGHPATIIASPRSELFRRARAAGLDPIGIHAFNEVDPQAVVRIVMVLRRLRPAILHLHTSHAHLLGLLAARFAPPLRLVVARRVDFSIYRHSFLGLNWIKYRYGVDCFLTVSRAVQELLTRDGIDPEKIRVVFSGVDPARFGSFPGDDRERLLRELELPPELPIVVSVGALARHKGHRFLVKAMVEVLKAREVAFLLVGSGPLRKSLQKLARNLGVQSRLRLLGFREDVGRILSSSSVFVFPSTDEGLGTSILDAFFLERPVVATRTGGIPELITDGENGLLVPPGDPAALARAILRVLDNPEEARRLTRRARKRGLESFTAEKMVEQTLLVYQELGLPG